MTHLLVTPWQHRAMGELLDQLEHGNRFFMHKSRLIPYQQLPVEDPAQRDPPRPRHHDHLIKRHIRSVQRK